MTELEKKVEEFIIRRYKLDECYIEDNEETREYMRMDVHTQYEEEYQLYLAGAIENGIAWHDLRKNPEDLPKEDKDFLIYSAEFGYEIRKYFTDTKGFSCRPSKMVFAWCEIPQFKGV